MALDIRCKVDNPDLADKFEDIRGWTNEQRGKHGNAATNRTAIRLAHDKLEELKEEEKELIDGYQEYHQKLKRLAGVN